jgi:hypothetical protein
MAASSALVGLSLSRRSEFARECARIRLDGGIGEIGPTAADVAGALQERRELRSDAGQRLLPILATFHMPARH